MAFTGAGLPSPSDVVIGDAPTRKSPRKPLLIGIALAILAVIILIVVIVSSNTSTNNASIGNLKTNFNRFANYVTSGNELASEINPDLDIFYNYYFVNEQYADIEERTSVIYKTGSLFSAFLADYQTLIGKVQLSSNDQQLVAIVNETYQLLNFFGEVYTKPVITPNDVANAYIKGGSAQVLQYINGYYNELPDNTYFSDFMTTLRNWANWQIQILDLYSSAGCAIGGTSCKIEDDAITTKIREYNDSLSNAGSSLNSYYNLSENFVLKVFVMNALVNNGDVLLYVTGGGSSNGN